MFEALARSRTDRLLGPRAQSQPGDASFRAFSARSWLPVLPECSPVLILAFLSNLNAAITRYGTGSAPIYFAPGYVSQNLWWLAGFIVSVLNLAIWGGIGPVWWETVGLW
jgi:DASS family divalent anion:Na+ symporter